MNRFFLPVDCIQGNRVTFPGDVAHQIRHVLRMRAGQIVQVLDNSGWVYEVVLERIANEYALGQVREKFHGDTEPKLRLTLCLSLTQREKFEWALQKCTELGVAAFLPVITSRSLVRRKDKVLAKYRRWKRIIREAAEQSQRTRLPLLHDPLLLSEAFERLNGKSLPCVILSADGAGLSMQAWLDRLLSGEEELTGTQAGLFIGPEGGYAPEEIEMAQGAGVQPVSLGKRILRMETAAVVSVALALNAFGELS